MSDVDELVKRMEGARDFAHSVGDGDGERLYQAAADTLTAQHKEIERLREALEPFGRVLSAYGKFAEYQLILLSEDNPKGRRLAHLTPENFYAAAALTDKEGGDG